MKIHELKLDDKYFNDVRDGIKTFEIRKNDRDFKAGDLLALSRYGNGSYLTKENRFKNEKVDIHDAETLLMRVDYISDYEQKDDYVVMSISPFKTDDEVDK